MVTLSGVRWLPLKSVHFSVTHLRSIFNTTARSCLSLILLYSTGRESDDETESMLDDETSLVMGAFSASKDKDLEQNDDGVVDF